MGNSSAWYWYNIMVHIFFLLGNPISQHPSVPVDDVMLVHDLICQTDNPRHFWFSEESYFHSVMTPVLGLKVGLQIKLSKYLSLSSEITLCLFIIIIKIKPISIHGLKTNFKIWIIHEVDQPLRWHSILFEKILFT